MGHQVPYIGKNCLALVVFRQELLVLQKYRNYMTCMIYKQTLLPVPHTTALSEWTLTFSYEAS